MNPDTALYESLTETPRQGESPTFWVSSLGHCVRKQVAQRAGIKPEKPIEAHSLFKMMVGTTVHAFVQKRLLSAGFLDPQYTKVIQTETIDARGRVLMPGDVQEHRFTYRSYSGKLDGWVKDQQIPFELKTCDDRAVKKPDWPEHYLYQGFTTCMAMGAEKFMLMQIGTSQGLNRWNTFPISNQWKRLVDEEIDKADQAWTIYKETGQLPEHTHKFSWENRYCPYA